MDEFNIYEGFIDDNTFSTLPFFRIPETTDDAYVEWRIGDRLDRLAYNYYENAALGKFILLANPHYITEGDINVSDILRIPLPKEDMFNYIRQRINQSKIF
jgi:hypothetical protein